MYYAQKYSKKLRNLQIDHIHVAHPKRRSFTAQRLAMLGKPQVLNPRIVYFQPNLVDEADAGKAVGANPRIVFSLRCYLSRSPIDEIAFFDD